MSATEAVVVAVVFMPILFPIAINFGIDPIHFGIMATVNLAIGYITLPYDTTLFASCGLSGQSIREVTPYKIGDTSASLHIYLFFQENSG